MHLIWRGVIKLSKKPKQDKNVTLFNVGINDKGEVTKMVSRVKSIHQRVNSFDFWVWVHNFYVTDLCLNTQSRHCRSYRLTR